MAQGFVLTLDTLQAPGTAVTAASRTSMTAGSTQARFTLPGGSIKQLGDIFYAYASGIISTVVTTPGTARFDIAMGTSLGTAIMDTGAMPLNAVARTNVPWVLQIWGTASAVGTAAQFNWSGIWISEDMINTALQATGPGPGGTVVPYSGTATGASVASATFDSTVSQLLDINFTQTVATGSCQLKQFYTQILTATGF